MPYRLRYDVNVDYVPPSSLGGNGGLGMTSPFYAGTVGNAGGGTTFYFTQLADPSSNTFTNADVANLLTAMFNDLLAQMEVTATQTAIQNAGTFSAIPPPGGA